MPKRPIQLRPPSQTDQYWLWGCVGLAVLLVLIGWVWTIRDTVEMGVQGIQERVQTVSETTQEAKERTAPAREQIETRIRASSEEITAEASQNQSDE